MVKDNESYISIRVSLNGSGETILQVVKGTPKGEDYHEYVANVTLDWGTAPAVNGQAFALKDNIIGNFDKVFINARAGNKSHQRLELSK